MGMVGPLGEKREINMSGSRSEGLHLSHYRTYCYCSYVTRVRHQVSRHEKLMSGKEKQYMTTSHDEESALTRKSTWREGKEEMMERGNHGTPCVNCRKSGSPEWRKEWYFASISGFEAN